MKPIALLQPIEHFPDLRGGKMLSRFALTLVVNRACNLRCTYCYTGDKIRRRLPLAAGQKAIDRAIHSLSRQGTLELAFFGGEPLLEAELILELVAYARAQTARQEVELSLSMTTNGTIDSPAAWKVMTLPEMQLAVSHDGLPGVHDRHRVTIDRQASSHKVNETLARLVDEGRDFRVVMVVRPDTVDQLPNGMEYLFGRGVRRFDPSLDLWTTWNRSDGDKLREAISRAADFWLEHLPECSVSWFDEKAARLTNVPCQESARCGFGVGEIAVTPAGNLYPCERLIGADESDNPMRLAGDVFQGNDFLSYHPSPGKSLQECSQCALNSLCSTTCRCSNYVRTGDVTRPDGLLCMWDQACYRETVRVLQSQALVNQ
jgi:uncharacterized protein